MLFTLRHLFTPHYSNDHRARILHPAGLSVLIAFFILTQSSLQLLRYAPLPEGLVLGYASNISASQVVDMTNTERSKAGLGSLSYSSSLSQAAQMKAEHMFSNNYWAHISPDGKTPWEFIRGAGYNYSVAGENLARDFDSTGPMVAAWMASPTHKDNIVNQKYSEIGVAVVDGVLEGVETTLVVQMFGTPTGPQIAAAPPPAITQESVQSNPQPIVEEAEDTTNNELPVGEQLTAEVVDEETIEEPVAEIVPETSDVLRYDSALGVTLSEDRGSLYRNTYVSPLSLTKAISTSIVMLVMGVLLYDVFYIHKKKIPRVVGKNWAHLTFFSLVVMFILGLTQGKVL